MVFHIKSDNWIHQEMLESINKRIDLCTANGYSWAVESDKTENITAT